MIINHNIPALNTYRQMGINQGSQQNAMEKLSSGLRINRAGDDAAGLAISEKMRGQIRGLDQASRNGQDGISMIQTTEGALNETHSILQRMRELAVQSSNDTNTQSDREELQKEVNQLSEEISRIGQSTEFNTQKLLDGSLEDKKFQIGANEGQNLTLSVNDMQGFSLGVAGDAGVEVTDTTVTALGDGEYSVEGNLTDGLKLMDSDGNQVGQSADGLVWNDMAATPAEEFTFVQGAVDSGTITIEGGEATGTAKLDNTGLEAGDYTIKFAAGASTIEDTNGNVIASSTDDTIFKNAAGDAVLTLTAAASADMDISVGGTDISSQTAASEAITTINNAIESVSAERSMLGATQNRLEHTINNLDTSAENLQAAESRIRDVDMAREMMEMTRANILGQASQAMLAQANQAPQAVLQLLG